MSVGETIATKKSLHTLVGKADEYRDIFELFLLRVSTMPLWMQPDSIVFSKVVYKFYGSVNEDAKEAAAEAMLRSRFPGIGKHVDFGTDRDNSSVHDDHIHVSFGWPRAGNPRFFLKQDNSGDQEQPEIILGTPPVTLDEEAKSKASIVSTTSFASKGDVITAKVVADILVNTGLFNIEEIATIVGIMKRESAFKPYANNPQGAMGLMQIVFNNGTGWEDENLPIVYGESKNKKNGTIVGYLLRNQNYNTAAQSKVQKWDATTVDPVFWYPINQIVIMAYQMQVYKSQSLYVDSGSRTSSQSKKLWSNWGDGAWGRANNQMPYGVLSSVSRDTVKTIYEYLGGTWSKYKTWGQTALVDEYTKNGSKIKRPANNDETQALKKENSSQYNAAPYRNIWDFELWYIGPNNILPGNKPRVHYPASFSDVKQIVGLD